MKGSITEECGGELADALTAYKKAESCVPQMKDKQLVSRLYSRLGILNDKTQNYSLAKEYYHKALDVNTTIGNSHSQVSNLINLFNMYLVTQSADSARWSLKRLHDIGKTEKDSILLAKVYHTLAVGEHHLGDNNQTEELLIQSLRFTPNKPSLKTLSLLANIYLSAGHKEKADCLYQNVLMTADPSVRATVYGSLYREAQADERYKEAMHFAELYMDVQEDFYNNSFQGKALEIQKKYDQMEVLYQNVKLKNRIYTIILASLFVLVCIIYGFKLLIKRFQQSHARLTTEKDTLQNHLQEKKKEKEVLDRQMQFIYGHTDLMTVENLQAMQSALTLLAERTCHWGNERKHIYRWLDISRNNLASRLTALSPALKEQYKDICCLLALGLSIDEVAEVLKVNSRTVEKYMTQLCRDRNLPKHGKEGFWDFLNSFIQVGKSN